MLHEYRCNKCEKVEDRIVKVAEMEDQTCAECGEKLELIPTFSRAVQFKGYGWTRKGR